jgi:hypothetical protein
VAAREEEVSGLQDPDITRAVRLFLENDDRPADRSDLRPRLVFWSVVVVLGLAVGPVLAAYVGVLVRTFMWTVGG